jgi:predicted house-cleaning noncanonical NTP pyrophosphatase (MazG superfamily)
MSGKLVRDGVPRRMEADGLEPVVRRATPEQFRVLLREKLVEEALELSRLPAGDPRSIDELSDVLEVVRAIALDAGIDIQAIDDARAEKLASHGGFVGRLVLTNPDAT